MIPAVAPINKIESGLSMIKDEAPVTVVNENDLFLTSGNMHRKISSSNVDYLNHKKNQEETKSF